MKHRRHILYLMLPMLISDLHFGGIIPRRGWGDLSGRTKG